MWISQRADITVSSYVYLNNPIRFHIDPHRQQNRSIDTAYLCTGSSFLIAGSPDVFAGRSLLFSSGSEVFAGRSFLFSSGSEVYFSGTFFFSGGSEVYFSGTFFFSGGSEVFASRSFFFTNRKEIYSADIQAKNNKQNQVRFTITLRQHTV
jgi:hypothetical protein